MPCSGGQNQEWTLPRGPIESGIPGKCIADYPNLTTKANKIALNPCNGTAAQLWMAGPDGTVRTGGKCLEVHSGGTASGTLVDTYRCNGAGAQRWRLISDGGGVMLKNPRSGLCLADPGDSTVNGARLEILSCSRHDPGMAWRVA